MRVLYFTRDYTTHDHHFLQKLSESDHEILYLRLENNGIRYDLRPIPEKVRILDWPNGVQPPQILERRLGLMTAFESILDQERPDLVHAGPIQLCAFMTALSGFRPLLAMSWGSDMLIDAHRDETSRWITRYTLERSDGFHCDCDSVRKALPFFKSFPDKRIVQFPFGIDFETYSSLEPNSDLRKRLGWENNFVVLSMRSWEPIYGVDTLLEAFRRAYRKENRLRLILLGSGPLASKIEQYIEENHLREVIYKPGRMSQEQLPTFFRSADVFMSASHSDGSSVSLLEAMATGLIVIVSDAPGNREWISHGKGGFLAAIGDADSFEKCLLKSTRISTEERRAIATRNQRIVKERADWHSNFSQLIEMYERLTQSRPRVVKHEKRGS